MAQGTFWRSRIASEALGVLLVLAGVLAALSLFSYDPRDPNLFSITAGGEAASPTNWIGGFGASLSSALYALVTHIVTGARLTISGPMGMRGARQYVKTYELAADGDGTLVTTTASMLGDIDDELRESYTTGGLELLQALKAHAESKVG